MVSNRIVQSLVVVHTILFIFLILIQDPFVLHGGQDPFLSLFLFLVDLPAYICATFFVDAFTGVVPAERIDLHEVLFSWAHVIVFALLATFQWILVGLSITYFGKGIEAADTWANRNCD